MNKKINIINIFIIIFLIKGNINQKEETCEEKEEYKLVYDNNFLNQKSDNYFEFKLNEKIIEYIKENKMITYPRKIFYGSPQGNFLHFVYLTYIKKLPLYFSYDHILYPYIEITQEITENILEKGIYNIFYNFLEKIVDYINKNKNIDDDLLIFFSIGFKLLNPDFKNEKNETVTDIINNILNITDLKNNNHYNFTLFGYERNINKINFIKINPLFNNNINSKRLFYSITFFQNFIFEIRNELYIIYLIGDIIYKTGQEKIYKELKKYFKYIFNEEENIMNPVEIYEYINHNYNIKNKTKDNINFNLYYKIKDNIIKNRTFFFMSKFEFNNEKEEIEFNNQIKSKISLFSYPYNIKDWINYKLLNINKKRLFPSFFEFITLVHNGNKMKHLIMNRYNYVKNKNISKEYKMLKFRDGINMEKEFNEVKEILNDSMNNQKDIWENSYENSFNYLLNIIGHSNDEKEDNNIWFESKIFNTLIGSYVHFKKDFLLFEQTTLIEGQEGELIDVYFEEDNKFYEELKEITKIFKKYSLNIINEISDKKIKEELNRYISSKLNRLFISYENIIKGIEYQNDINKEKEKKNLIKNLFYYNKEKNIYEGWYVDLYKKNDDTEINYFLKIFAYNYHVSQEIKELNFNGSVIFGAMNYPEFGVIGIKDKINKMKLYISCFYSGNEYPHALTDEIDFKSLKRIIIKR